MNNLNKAKYLNDVVNNVQSKKNKILQDYFTKLYYISLLNKTKADSRNKLISEKLKNLINSEIFLFFTYSVILLINTPIFLLYLLTLNSYPTVKIFNL